MIKTHLPQMPTMYAPVKEICTVDELDSTGKSNILYPGAFYGDSPADIHPPGKIRYE